MPSTFLSVIVCTRNRADELAGCLPLLANQARSLPDVEVLVVDNGSTDNTREVVERVSSESRFAIRYTHEPEAGLCRARNHGRAAARGEVLAYVDDDVRVRPGWMGRVREHFLAGKSDCLAGKVTVEVEGERPAWFPGDLLWILGETTFGDGPRPISFPLHPQGNNFAVRREVFDAAGGFDPRITLYGDETEFFRRVSRHDYTTLYDPEVVVTQRIPARRLSRKALRRKAYIWGRGSAMVWLMASPGAGRRWAEASRYVLRAAYVGARWCLGPRFGRSFTFWHNCGKARQLITGVR